MTCFCGDTECSSCGTAQGTYKGPPYDYQAVVPIGRDPDGRQVAVEFVLRTYGNPEDERLTTELKPYRGIYTRACFVVTVEQHPQGADVPVQWEILEWLRKTLPTWQNLWVTRDWIDALLEYWDRYHLNDAKAGTEAQLQVVADMSRVVRNPTPTAILKLLENRGLLVDRGYEYGSAWLEHGPGWLIRPLDQATTDEIIYLAEEGFAQSERPGGKY